MTRRKHLYDGIMDIQTLLRREIEDSSLSQGEIADALNITESALSQYKSGERKLPMGLIIPLCRILKSNALVHHLNHRLGLLSADCPAVPRDSISASKSLCALDESVSRAKLSAISYYQQPTPENRDSSLSAIATAIAELLRQHDMIRRYGQMEITLEEYHG